MSYDLAVWVGPQPTSARAASRTFDELMDQMETAGGRREPSPRIRAYVDDLLARWPDISEDEGDDSPWADGPLLGDAWGDAIYFSMVWSRCEEASEFAANLARQHDLVCYDPQLEQLRPELGGEPRARPGWFTRRR